MTRVALFLLGVLESGLDRFGAWQQAQQIEHRRGDRMHRVTPREGQQLIHNRHYPSRLRLRPLTRTVRTLLTGFIFAQLIPPGTVVGAETTGLELSSATVLPDVPGVRARLERQWKELRPVRSASIRYRRFYQEGNRKMTVEQLRQFLRTTRLSDEPDRLRDLFELGVRSLKDNEEAWSVTHFYFDQGKTRENGSLFDQIYDGETEIVVDRNNRFIRLYRPDEGEPRGRRPELSIVRFIPAETLLDEAWSVAASTEDLTTLRFESGVELRLDNKTGAPLTMIRHNPSGEVIREYSQLDWEPADDGTLFPSVIVDARFHDNQVYHLMAAVIEAAEFNTEIPGDTFVVEAGTGDLIRDRRTDEWTDFAPQAPIPDVMALMGGTSPRSEQEREWSYRRMYWMAGIGLAAAIAAAIWLGRSRS